MNKKQLITFLLLLTGSILKAQEATHSNELNPRNIIATLRNDTLFVHKDTEEFANFDSATPREVAFNKFRKVSFYREKTIWFLYVVYDYGLVYVGRNKGGREIYEPNMSGRLKFIPRRF